MPASRRNRGNNEGPLLSTWRQEGPSGGRAKLWLVVRRSVATLLLLVLMGALGYWLLRPFWLPKTYFAYIGANEIASLAVPPIDFVYEDVAGFTALDKALAPWATKPSQRSQEESNAAEQSEANSGPAKTAFLKLTSDKYLNGRNQPDERLSETAIGGLDTLIVYFNAHGVVRDGKPYLLGNDFDPRNEQGTLIDVRERLIEINGLPAAVKIVLMDAGRLEYAPRLGVLAPGFASALRQTYQDLVESERLDSVYVLCANSDYETAKVSRWLKRSVFGYISALGLQGAADSNGDGRVRLEELHRFVAHNVAKWTAQATDNDETQSPFLLTPDNGPRNPHVLFSSRLPEYDSTPSAPDQDHESREKMWVKLASAAADRIEEFGVVGVSTAARTTKERLSGGGGGRGASNGGADSEQSAADDSNTPWEQRLEEAWELTQQIDKSPSPPRDYAPHLWRRHISRLIAMDDRQATGMLKLKDRTELDEKLRDIRQSLRALAKPSGEAVSFADEEYKRIAALRPSSPLAPEQAPSLAIAEEIAAASGRGRLDEKLQEFISQFDDWLADDRAGFSRLTELINDAWEDARSWEEALDQYYELHLLEAVQTVETPLNLKKKVLLTRRLGEQVAANPYWGLGWAASTVDRADRRRLEAERLFFTQAADGWADQVGRKLDSARKLYQEALSQLSAVRELEQLYNESRGRLPSYLAWMRLWGGGEAGNQSAEALRGLLQTLRLVRDALEAPRETSRAATQSLANELDDLKSRLAYARDSLDEFIDTDVDTRAGAENPPAPRQIGALLRSSFVSPESRTRLRKLFIDAEQKRMSGFQLDEDFRVLSATQSPDQSASRKQQQVESLQAQFEFETHVLAEFGLGQREAARGINRSEAPGIDRLLTLGEELGELVSSLPGVIASKNRQNEEAGKWVASRRVTEALALIHPVDSNGGEAERDFRAAERAAEDALNEQWRRLFGAARARRIAAMRDAFRGAPGGGQSDNPLSELSRLNDQADTLERLARQIDADVRSPQLPSAAIELTSVQPAVIDLNKRQRKQTVSLTIESRRQEPTQVWIIAEYDRSKLSVRGSTQNEGIILAHQISSKPVDSRTELDSDYPYHPAARDFSSTLTLPGNGEQQVSLEVSRTRARGDTKLVIKAVTKDDYLRHVAAVQMPSAEEIRVLRVDGRESGLASVESLKLHPNRPQEITLDIANVGDKKRTIQATLLAPGGLAVEAESIVFPDGFVSRGDAQEYLKSFESRKTIAISEPIKDLDPGDRRKLSFQFAVGSSEDPKATPLFAAPNGLLLVLEDAATRAMTIRWLRLEVWKPRSFLSAKAEYDDRDESLKVTVEADPSPGVPMPSGQIKAQLHVDREYVSRVGSGADAGVIRGPSGRCTLTSTLNGRRPSNRDGSNTLPVSVSIDQYPRAFLFDIPNRKASGIQPAAISPAIRVVSPPDNKEYKAQDFITPLVEVDVFEGFFDVPDAVVRIGVDNARPARVLTDRDVEVVTFRSDRQVEFAATAPSGDGSILLRNKVGDLRPRLPTSGINGRINILGEIHDGRPGEPTIAYSEVTLDGSPPEIIPGSVSTNVIGENLLVEFETGSELTGVSKVEGVLDGPGIDEPKWEPGKLDDKRARWVIEIPLDFKKISAGSYNLLLRATDRVTNVHSDSQYVRRSIVIKPPVTKSGPRVTPVVPETPLKGKKPKIVTNRVYGTARYSPATTVRDLSATLTSLDGKEKELEADSTAGGRFAFDAVPPGKYTLTVIGQAGGAPRKGVMKITVSKKPRTPKDVGVVKIVDF